MEKKFDSWSQLPAPATAAADVKKAASTVTVSLPPAVAAFEVQKMDVLPSQNSSSQFQAWGYLTKT